MQKGQGPNQCFDGLKLRFGGVNNNKLTAKYYCGVKYSFKRLAAFWKTQLVPLLLILFILFINFKTVKNDVEVE